MMLETMAPRFHKGLVLVAALLALGLAGCSSAGPDKECQGAHEYLESRDLPPLITPEGLVFPERSDELVIPEGPRASTSTDPEGLCLDRPPDYFNRKKPVAANGQTGGGSGPEVGATGGKGDKSAQPN